MNRKISLKGRTSGATTMKPVIVPSKDEAPSTAEQVAELLFRISYVKHVQYCATQRKQRLEDLMQRRSAQKWDASKKAKMVRRLVTANQMLEQCIPALDEMTTKLEQLGPTRANNVASFVPAPATSVQETDAG